MAWFCFPFKRKKKSEEMISLPADPSPTVLLYDRTRNGQLEPVPGNSKCEDICKIIAKKLNIKPPMLHCFSLVVYNDSDNSRTWLSNKEYISRTDLETSEIHFRMRFLPSVNKLTKLSEFDSECIKYLYYQVNWDFLHDKWQNCAETEEKEIGAKARGVAVLGMLVFLRMETEMEKSNKESVKRFLKKKDFRLFLPNSLRKLFFDEYFLKRSIKGKMKEYQNNYPPARISSAFLMKAYLDHALKEEKNYYYTEHYVAFQVDANETSSTNTDGKSEQNTPGTEEMLNVTIEMGCQNHTLTISKANTERSLVMRSHVNQLFTLLMEKCEIRETVWWTTLINRQDGHPKVLFFKCKRTAYSFMSCLESYFRLACNFYQSLCSKLEPSCIKALRDIKSHGPITDEFAVQKFKKRCCAEVYILRVSATDYDEYEVLYQRDPNARLQKHKLGKVTKSAAQEGSTVVALLEMKAWLHHAIQDSGFIPHNCQRIQPQSEGCDILQNFLLDKETETIPEEEVKSKRLPEVYMSDSVVIQSLIGQGYFTETTNALVNYDDQVVVKRLRGQIPVEHYQSVHQAFQEGCDKFLKLVSLKDQKFFVGFLGLTLSTNQGMLMKRANHGSLKKFLQTKDHTLPQLTLHHMVETTVQLASALLYLDDHNCCHGNLHCDNILVFKFDYNSIAVRIGDPGLVSLYNKLPLDSEINKNRLPWLAPEMYKDLSKITTKTDMFACGTTLWQMFSEGFSPLEATTQLKGKTVAQICEFFSSDSRLPCPVHLETRRDDSEVIKKIKQHLFTKVTTLWLVDSEARPDAASLLSNINAFVQSYGDSYHDYSIIPADLLESMSSPEDRYPIISGQPAEQSEDSLHRSIIHSSGVFTSGSVSHDVPVGDLATLTGQKVPEHTPPSSPPTDFSEVTSPGQVVTAKSTELTLDNLPSTQTSVTGSSKQLQNTQTKPGAKTVTNESTGLKTACSVTGPTLPVSNGPILNAGTQLANKSTVSSIKKSLGKLPAIPLANPTQRLSQNSSPPAKGATVSNINFLIKTDRLQVDNKCQLGAGHYGHIYKGILAPNSSSDFTVPQEVAVKVLKPSMADQFREEFIKEARIMEQLRHMNIVKFYGICHDGRYVVMEFVANNSLIKYSKENEGKIEKVQMIKFAVDISNGMAYLSSKHMIHCDLAARNVLLTDTLLAKVSDFGLSKILSQDKEYYRRQKDKTIPVQWCAPEWIGFQKKFTSKSDVWSFGVVLWEIFTYGKPPLKFDYQKDGLVRLNRGERLGQPEACDDLMYNVMMDCWKWEDEKRPDFQQLHDRLTDLWKQNGGGKTSYPNHYSMSNAENNLVQVPASSSPPSIASVNPNLTPRVTGLGNIQPNGESAPVLNPKSSSKNVRQTSAPHLGNHQMRSEHHAGQEENCIIIKESDVVIDEQKKLGKGSFGEVFLAKYQDKNVALKRCTANQHRFKREYELLYKYKHENIVKFIGIYKPNKDANVEYVMEYMARGDLQKYLQQRKTKQQQEKYSHTEENVKFLIDIAKGMDFLCSSNVIHCDLTAANVLLTEDLTAKISDFGWGKDLGSSSEENFTYNRKEAKFKVRWAPPEVLLHEQYHRYSDIWSYGVLCIEVFLDGDKPDLSPPTPSQKDLKQFNRIFIERISAGEIFKQPRSCPDEIFQVMSDCWKKDPTKRIKFNSIVESFTRYN